MDFEAAMKSPVEKAWEDLEADIPIDPPAKIDPLDPAPLLKLFDRYVEKIDGMNQAAALHKVVDDESNASAVEMTTQAKKLAQAIAKQHKDIKAPYLAVIQPLDAFKKGLSDKLATIQGILNGKITPYLRKKEDERREAERKAREEARRIQAELEAKAKAEAEAERKRLEAENKPEEAAAVVPEVVPQVVAQVDTETKTVTETGSAKLKTEWTFEILSFKDLPDAAFIERHDAVQAALSPWVRRQVAAGIRNVPGVRIFEQSKIDTRTRR